LELIHFYDQGKGEEGFEPARSAMSDDLIPESVEEYRKKEYWDWRYEK